MNKNKHNRSNIKVNPAFTIIEVVLVLAIAGLIFLMVFVALPALQRSQRDAQRRNDVATVKAALENYKTNNQGRYPWDSATVGEGMANFPSADFQPFVDNYLHIDQDFSAPSGDRYTFWVPVFGTRYNGWRYSNSYSFMTVGVNSSCNGEVQSPRSDGRKDKYTIRVKLENGRSYCLEG